MPLTLLAPDQTDLISPLRPPVLIAGTGPFCGKSHVASLLSKLLVQKRPDFCVVATETSHPIETLIGFIKDYPTVNMARFVALGWIGVMTYPNYDIFTKEQKSEFSEWLIECYPAFVKEIKAPLPPGVDERGRKLLTRNEVFTPIAKKVTQVFGGAALVAFAWNQAVRDHRVDICLIAGVRTPEDCSYGKQHKAILARVVSTQEVVHARFARFGVTCTTELSENTWDVQLREAKGMFDIPNNHLVGGDEKQNQLASTETENALSMLITRIHSH